MTKNLFVLLATLAGCVTAPQHREHTPPVRDDAAISLHAVLRPLLGKPCALTPKGSLWVVGFRDEGPDRTYKFDMLGADFLRVANATNRHYIPFSAITVITTD
jgi:hypothetical protein